MPGGRIDYPRPSSPSPSRLGSPGSAAATDARDAAAWLLRLLRPGAGNAVDPLAPGPRAPVPPSALYQLTTTGLRVTERTTAQLARLGSRVYWRPQLTAEQEASPRRLRGTNTGRAKPLSYVHRFAGKVGAIVGTTTTADDAAAPEAGSDPFPCIDCGG